MHKQIAKMCTHNDGICCVCIWMRCHRMNKSVKEGHDSCLHQMIACLLFYANVSSKLQEYFRIFVFFFFFLFNLAIGLHCAYARFTPWAIYKCKTVFVRCLMMSPHLAGHAGYRTASRSMMMQRVLDESQSVTSSKIKEITTRRRRRRSTDVRWKHTDIA